MTAHRAEKVYEKHAWIILFALGIVYLVASLFFMWFGVDVNPGVYVNTTGMTADELATSDPQVASLLVYSWRLSGTHFLGFAVLIIAISIKSFRTGEKWAWYALWILPVFLLIQVPVFISVEASSGELGLSVLLTIVSLLGLFLPYRKFFPKKQGAMS